MHAGPALAAAAALAANGVAGGGAAAAAAAALKGGPPLLEGRAYRQGREGGAGAHHVAGVRRVRQVAARRAGEELRCTRAVGLRRD